MTAFTAEEKLKCAERELKLRLQVYPRFVENGRFSKEKSDREIALMSAIVEDYRALAQKDTLFDLANK
jgi:hypothetical protein